MKRILLSGILFFGLNAQAQLAAGSIAPDFTLTDRSGTVHNLYTYLNAGKTVFLDISATWCGPCFEFKGTGAFEDLWVNHGPTGGTAVSSSTTNDVIVLYIEGDGTTTEADLLGTGSNTQGDWVTGVNHPIIDPATSDIDAFNTAYAIGYFPTIYKVCPNRQVTEMGTGASWPTADELYASVATCPVASGANNPALISYVGETSNCSAIDVSVTLQNMGTSALTTATIVIKQGTTVLATKNWTGNLAAFGTEVVLVGSVSPTSPTSYTIEITSADDVTTDNTVTQTLSSAPSASSNAITIQINCDQYGTDTAWELTDGSGTVVASGGPYTDASAAGVYPQAPVLYNTTTPDDCYTMTVTDVYGDGMSSVDTGEGGYTVKDAAGTTLVSGDVFTSSSSGKFKSGLAGIEENDVTLFNVYPNPATDNLTVSFEAKNSDYSVSILDLTGRKIASNEYSNLSGVQNINLPLNGISTGNYILNIASEGKSFNQKVTIK